MAKDTIINDQNKEKNFKTAENILYGGIFLTSDSQIDIAIILIKSLEIYFLYQLLHFVYRFSNSALPYSKSDFNDKCFNIFIFDNQLFLRIVDFVES